MMSLGTQVVAVIISTILLSACTVSEPDNGLNALKWFLTLLLFLYSLGNVACQ